MVSDNGKIMLDNASYIINVIPWVPHALPIGETHNTERSIARIDSTGEAFPCVNHVQNVLLDISIVPEKWGKGLVERATRLKGMDVQRLKRDGYPRNCDSQTVAEQYRILNHLQPECNIIQLCHRSTFL